VDRGATWQVSSTPIRAGAATEGIFSIAFRDADTALVVGGDYQAPDRTGGNIAISADGGLFWTLVPEPHGVGFRSGVAWREASSDPMWVAVGTSGSSFSLDGGRRWATFDSTSLNAVAFAEGTGWAAGPDGRIARLVVR
jgi:hypothetical protein